METYIKIFIAIIIALIISVVGFATTLDWDEYYRVRTPQEIHTGIVKGVSIENDVLTIFFVDGYSTNIDVEEIELGHKCTIWYTEYNDYYWAECEDIEYNGELFIYNYDEGEHKICDGYCDEDDWYWWWYVSPANPLSPFNW